MRQLAIVTLLLGFFVSPLLSTPAWAVEDVTLAQADLETDPEVAQEIHEEEAHADDHGDPNLLAVDPATLIWQLILFVILLAVLAKFVWPNILTGLKARENKIRVDLEEAERAAREASATLASYQARLDEAQKEAAQVVEQARNDANKVAAQLRTQTEQEIRTIKERAQADIETAKERALNDLYEQAAFLATQVAGQILKREIRPEDQQALVDESLDALKRSQAGAPVQS